jgi:type I restriction enzyme R subunit
MPANPSRLSYTASLQAELDQLRQDLDATRSDAERAVDETAAQARLSAEERAERAFWEQLAAETEQAKAALAQQLQALQAAATQAPAQAASAIIDKAQAAARLIVLDEATARAIIDAQLRVYGWKADTVNLRYRTGARPAKGRCMAIAEWSAQGGMADYALFVDTQCVGISRPSGVTAAIPRYAKLAPHAGGM